jgi:hypothetical protein
MASQILGSLAAKVLLVCVLAVLFGVLLWNAYVNMT